MEFLSKSCSEFELRKAIELAMARQETEGQEGGLKDFFFVKIGRLIRKIEVSQIELLQVDGKYLTVFVDGTHFPVRSTLQHFARKLPANFVQVHQSFVVNIKFVQSIDLEENTIYLKSGKAMLSRSFRKAFLNSYFHA